MATYNPPLARQLIHSLLASGANRYAKNQAGQYPFQLCNHETIDENPELKLIRNLLKPTNAEQLFIDHVINNPHIKPLLEKVSTNFLLMGEIMVRLRSDEQQKTYQLPGELGITLLFEELELFYNSMQDPHFQSEDKVSWNHFLATCLTHYQTMTSTLYEAQKYAELKPKALGGQEQEIANALILHLQQINQAIFIGNQQSAHQDELIQGICIPGAWVKEYGLTPAEVQPSKKRNPETDKKLEAKKTASMDEPTIPSAEKPKTDDASIAELTTKVEQLKQENALLHAEIEKMKQQMMIAAEITNQGENTRSNSTLFLQTLRK